MTRIDELTPAIGHPGPLLIALPGCGCSPRIFDALQLDGVAVQALDWCAGPGPHDPASVAARLAQALAARGGPTYLAGHSAGGAIAALAAAHLPGRIDALIISNTGVHSRAHGDPGLPERIRTRWDAAAQQDFLRGCFLHPPPAALWHALTDYLAALPRQALLQAVLGLRATDLGSHLPAIRMPVLIAHGRDDHRRRIDDAQALAQGIAGAQLALLPGGHTPMVDDPAAYRQALQAFLARVRCASSA
ncbi:alpha/beta hydrolase [Orrella sp. JC864]|uniref:alpha/beta fold hydrolase n=1 Tax=Orrella sp. JC864 TaxID=3120298 RepID=UPI00300A4D6A